MDIPKAIARFIACGIHERDIRIKKTITNEWRDSIEVPPVEFWSVDAKLSAAKTVNHDRTIHERGPSLEQLVARVELLCGVTRPGDDLKESKR